MSNLETVQSIYAAFGRGDVPAILATMSPDVDWEYGWSDSGVPWLAPRRGVQGVTAFFEALHTNVEFQRFEVNEMLSQDHLVVVLVSLAFTVRRTGVQVQETDEVHVWRFDESGKIYRFRHALDSRAHRDAWFAPPLG